MTKFSTLKTQFTDGETLKAALQNLGFTFKTKAYVRGHRWQKAQADIVVVLKGKYDLGFYKGSDESFILIIDLWGVSQEYKITELIYSIMQEYRAISEKN
jgi:hypothetical protein